MKDDNYYSLLNPEYCYIKTVCPDYGKKDVCVKLCRRGDNMNYFIATSGLPKRYRNILKLDPDTVTNSSTLRFLEYLFNNLEYFIDNGFCAYYYGAEGTGKTSWAAAVLNKYFRIASRYGSHRVAGLYVSVTTLLTDLKRYPNHTNSRIEEYIQDIESCPIVVWDDLFLTEYSPFELTWLYRLTHNRVINGLSNIYISTISPMELMSFNKKLYYCMCSNSTSVEFNQEIRNDNDFVCIIEKLIQEQDQESNNPQSGT